MTQSNPTAPDIALPTISLRDITLLTARLAQILAEEADSLQNMDVKNIEPMQKEKNLITQALETQQRLLMQDPSLLVDVSPEERKELQVVVQVFQDMLAENHRRLLIAKEVNHRVVQAIAATVAESSTNNTYDDSGIPSMANKSLSVTLNEMI